MTGHLCLKWNNHSSAFLKSISNIHIKERYCDATIACQGKYFPVHRVVLSTCSDYFDEMFERMQCQHPYIVFKDIEPREMELLLNYMYQGEVNVVQEMLPTLIKAAEALKVKGLAVPDDMPSNKDSSCGKKRTNTSNDNPQPKRRSEESRRRRRDSSELHTNSQTTENSDGSSLQNNEGRLIKEEPVDSGDYADGALDAAFGDGGLPGENPSASHDPDSKNEDVFGNFAAIPDEGAVFIKSEPAALVPHEDPYEEQSSSWSDFGSGSVLPNLPTSEVGGPDDISERNDAGSGRRKCNAGLKTMRSHTPSHGSRAFPQPRPHASTVSRSCPFCEYKSYNQSHVKRHIMYRHTGGERPYLCGVCSKRFMLSEYTCGFIRARSRTLAPTAPRSLTKRAA